MNAFPKRSPHRTLARASILLGLILIPGLARGEWVSVGGAEGSLVEVRVLESSDQRIVLEYDVPGFFAEPIDIDGKVYYQLELPGESNLLDAGLPELPHICRSVIIPDRERVLARVVEVDYDDVPDLPVVPSKGNLLRTVDPASVPYTFDPIYETDRWCPGSMTTDREPYILRDYRGVVVDVTPFQARGNDGMLRVARHLIVEVVTNGPDSQNTINRSGPPEQVAQEFGALYAHHFLNWGMDRYTPILERGPMLIITYDAFHDAMLPLVEWKRQQGIPTDIVDVSTIGNDQTAIDQEIEQRFMSDGLCYVLLVGDRAQVASYMRGSDESDPSYSLILGNDSYPELFVGRFSAENLAHVETQVSRSVTYEMTPMGGADWYHMGTGIASDQGPGDDGEYDNQHQDVIRQKLLNYGYTHVDQIYDPYGTAAQVSAALNDGRSTVNYTGHGSTTAWSSTGFSNTHVNALTNDWMLPFITSVACVNGDFGTTTCFGETWLRATNGGNPSGAIGTYMSSVNQSWNPPMCAQDETIDLLVNDEMRTFGSLCYNGSCQMMDEYGTAGAAEFYYWHVFGDPSVMVRTKTPVPLTVQHDGVMLIGQESYTVMCPGVADAHCALYAEGVIYGAAYTDGSGMATIDLDFPIEDPMTLSLTVTGYNLIPAIEDVESLPPDGPFVVFSDYTVLDEEGDRDGACDAGETNGILLTLENVGVDTATDVTAILSTDDRFITVLISERAFEDILPDSTVCVVEPYVIEVDPAVPDGYSALFSIDVTAAEGSWECALSLPIQGPNLQAGPCMIDDSGPAGNGDGTADPGETFFMMLGVANTGHCDARALTGTLSLLAPGVTILDAEAICLNAPEGDSGVFSSFQLALDLDVPSPTVIPMHLSIVGENGYCAQLDYALAIGPFVDHAETDLGWTLGALDDSATSGQWVRLDPIGTEYNSQPLQPEDDHTEDPGTDCFVTGNGTPGGAAGEADVDGGKTTLLSPLFDLSNAISANVEYWRWYTNNLGNNPGEDYWDVDVTDDGTNWVHLEHTTESANSWNLFSFDLGSYIDFTDHVQLRFVADDSGSGSLVEAAVDDFALIVVRTPVTDVPPQEIRERFGLVSCSPNPFNPRSRIVYRLGSETATRLEVYDVSGRIVRTLVNGTAPAGVQAVVFDGRDDEGRSLSSGIYFVRLETPELLEVRQVTLLK